MNARSPQPSIAPVLIIPAYNPDQKLVDLIVDLQEQNASGVQFARIVVVNDGSDAVHQTLFDDVLVQPQVTLLTHSVNQGKGAALKTAFRWVEENASKMCVGVVTADADGQHLSKDILNIANSLKTSSAQLWLGAREFDRKSIPFRSWLGNTFTLKLFSVATGQTVPDTQTGLRGIPKNFLPELLKCKSCGYEFELDMLLLAPRHGYRFASQTIDTVYEDGNESSHYRPIVDSIRIYRRFLKFAAVGLSSAGIDYIAFATLYFITSDLLQAIVGARLLSASFNFMANRRWVFRSNGGVFKELCSYGCLAALMAGLSYLFTYGFELVGVTPYVGKLLAEVTVFILSYHGQRRLVFRN